MELKKIFILFILILFNNSVYAELAKPNKTLNPYDVVKIQLEALKNNDSQDKGIKQTWLFAHPDNKKITGPFDKFKQMDYKTYLENFVLIVAIRYFPYNEIPAPPPITRPSHRDK